MSITHRHHHPRFTLSLFSPPSLLLGLHRDPAAPMLPHIAPSSRNTTPMQFLHLHLHACPPPCITVLRPHACTRPSLSPLHAHRPHGLLPLQQPPHDNTTSTPSYLSPTTTPPSRPPTPTSAIAPHAATTLSLCCSMKPPYTPPLCHFVLHPHATTREQLPTTSPLPPPSPCMLFTLPSYMHAWPCSSLPSIPLVLCLSHHHARSLFFLAAALILSSPSHVHVSPSQ